MENTVSLLYQGSLKTFLGCFLLNPFNLISYHSNILLHSNWPLSSLIYQYIPFIPESDLPTWNTNLIFLQ